MHRMLIVFFLSLTNFAFAGQTTAPDFTLPDIGGNNYQLSKNFGKGPILINFWATWCLPCRSEMKALKKIYKKYKDDGLQVLSVSVDDPRTVSKVKGTVKTYRYPFTILLDTNSEVFQLYQGTNPPLSVLINKNGEIVYTHTGYRKGDEINLQKKIVKLLK
ncbi:MAG: TlpA family protein disulfide reductase [Calditrichaeota bacterium]|nr:TlpA family protein disulfide reductase [Calditrichota bacterium]